MITNVSDSIFAEQSQFLKNTPFPWFEQMI
jgi:hypothetical protein